MPIFVYRCDCGNCFERLVPRDADAPACPECGSPTRKIPAGPSIGRSASPSTPRVTGSTGRVPIPWQGVVSGGPEKLKRELAFRQRLGEAAVSGLRTPGGPDTRPQHDSGTGSGTAASS